MRRTSGKNVSGKGGPLRPAFLMGCAAALVAACAANPSSSLPVAETPAGVYRLGLGTVESVALVQTARPGPRASASTGGSIPVRAAYRVSVRMEDGTVQVIDQDSPDFVVGDRVRITGSGRVIRP